MNKEKVKKTTSKKPQPSAGSTETDILEAFTQLQYQKGAANIVLQDLAKEVGVAFGTIRYHFNQAGRDVSQEALVYVIKKAYVYIDDQLFKARNQESFNPVSAYIKAMFGWVQHYPADSSLLVYYYYLCTTQVNVNIPNKVFLEKARLRIEAYIHEAIGRKLYGPVDDVAAAALKIHMTVLGGCIAAGTQRSQEQFELQAALCLAVVEQILKPNKA